MQLWTMPGNYTGAIWPGYYVFLCQTRDSDCLTRSNFRVALAAIGGECDTIRVVRENNWLCGWVEWIAIHQDDEPAVLAADEFLNALSNYPVVNEDDFSELEESEALSVWQNCYNDRDRLAYIREHYSQFEFSDFRDMIDCVRGNSFRGYACELLH